ncbi:MAG TPA: hypothetical protein VMU83_12380 [Hanamia sp.]|nr:hypothetical protein [Hanamia sp.]
MKSVITGLSICFLCLAQNIFAQAPVIKTTVDKNNILIGQQINYRVATSMPDNTYRLSWFTMPDTLGNFITITKNKIDSTSSNGNLNFSQDFIITSFDSGRQVIPPLALSVSTLDGDSTFNIYTDSIPINVTYSPTDSVRPFHDIKTIIEVKRIFPWWAWVLVALGVVLLIIWILFLLKFFKKKKESVIFESKLSPYDEAMQLLSELEKENLLQNDQIKEFHYRLTEIFKRYLSRKTNRNQMYLTTDELLMELGNLDVPKEQIAGFANSLRMENAVKFAKYIPPAYENEKCFSQTKEMITNIHKIVNKKPENDL